MTDTPPIRDDASNLLPTRDDASNPLRAYTDEQLLIELRIRGRDTMPVRNRHEKELKMIDLMAYLTPPEEVANRTDPGALIVARKAIDAVLMEHARRREVTLAELLGDDDLVADPVRELTLDNFDREIRVATDAFIESAAEIRETWSAATVAVAERYLEHLDYDVMHAILRAHVARIEKAHQNMENET